MEKKVLWHMLIMIVLFISILGSRVFATAIHVPADYPTIQAGLNAASNGDTVLVSSGTYPENIIWPSVNGICLKSENGPWTTIIDGGGADRVIMFANSFYTQSTEINGFTIENGRAIGGAGIYVNGSPVIVNCIVQKNLAADTTGWIFGGGIFCAGSNNSPLIMSNKVRGNVVRGFQWNYGAGIYVDYQNAARIIGNVIEQDSAIGGYWNYGAGIFCDIQSRADIRHNIIRENVAYQGDRGHGVGVYVDLNSSVYMLSNLICDNKAQSGSWNYGAGVCINNIAELYNNTIVGNSCSGGNWNFGGGIYIASSTNYIGNNIVAGNTATAGGGIYCATPTGDAELLNNDVWNNSGGNYNGISPGINDIQEDPFFVTGPLGDYYLSQIAAGQGQNSPCLDHGFASAESLELDIYTTRTDSVYDSSIVDLGYHYPLTSYFGIGDEHWSARDPFQPRRLDVAPTLSSSSFMITLVVSVEQRIGLYIYDESGKRHGNLFEGICHSGRYVWRWKGRDDKGKKLPAGVYFVQVKTKTETLCQKVLLVR